MCPHGVDLTKFDCIACDNRLTASDWMENMEATMKLYAKGVGMSFQVGDVVQLKSGGPKMTVEEVVEEPSLTYVKLVYFDDNNFLQRETMSAMDMTKLLKVWISPV